MGSTPKLSKSGKVVLGVLVLLGLFLAKTYWWDNRPEVVAEREEKAKQDSIASLAKQNIDTTNLVVPETLKTETGVTSGPKPTETVSKQTVSPTNTQKVKEKKAETPKAQKPAPKKTTPKKPGERENLEFNNF